MVQATIEIVALASDKANPVIVNPLIHMWQVIHESQLLSHAFLEYLKVVEIVMVHALDLLKTNNVINLLLSWKTKCTIVWIIICTRLSLWMHKSFSHLAPSIQGYIWDVVKCSISNGQGRYAWILNFAGFLCPLLNFLLK